MLNWLKSKLSNLRNGDAPKAPKLTSSGVPEDKFQDYVYLMGLGVIQQYLMGKAYTGELTKEQVELNCTSEKFELYTDEFYRQITKRIKHETLLNLIEFSQSELMQTFNNAVAEAADEAIPFGKPEKADIAEFPKKLH